MSDQRYREIHLGGKQLVFLFMASVVVAVAVFLLGVSVGRGVRNATVVATAPGTDVPVMAAAEPAAPVPPPTVMKPEDKGYAGALQTPAGARAGEIPATVAAPGARLPDPAAAAPAVPASAAAKTAEPKPSATVPATSAAVKPPPPAAAPAAAKPATPVVSAPAASAKPSTPVPPPPAMAPVKPVVAPAASTAAAAKPPLEKPAAKIEPAAKPAGAGSWVVQVDAFKDRGNAEAQVAALKKKGHAAFLVPPTATIKLFRVRVGPFDQRPDADKAAATLRGEGHKPSVTR